MGYTFSTPTPEETRRTVNVPPASVPCLRARTRPSNAWRRVFPFSSIFRQTRTVSPGRRSRFLRASMSIGEVLIVIQNLSRLPAEALAQAAHYTIHTVRKQLPIKCGVLELARTNTTALRAEGFEPPTLSV